MQNTEDIREVVVELTKLENPETLLSEKHALLVNRAKAFAQLSEHKKSIADSEAAIRERKSSSEAYQVKCAALTALGKLEDAVLSAVDGLVACEFDGVTRQAFVRAFCANAVKIGGVAFTSSRLRDALHRTPHIGRLCGIIFSAAAPDLSLQEKVPQHRQSFLASLAAQWLLEESIAYSPPHEISRALMRAVFRARSCSLSSRPRSRSTSLRRNTAARPTTQRSGCELLMGFCLILV